MSRVDKRDRISYETLERKYHEARAEVHQLRSQLADQDNDHGTLLAELEGILDRAKGYWRLGKSSNGHYWVRWKWTAGAETGRYSIGGHSTLAYAVLACLADISLVEAGKKDAPLDVGYRS